MSLRTDVYTAITPFGIVEADFPEDGGVIYSGPQAAMDHLQAVISEVTGSGGYLLNPTTVEPNDFFHFCQPKGSGVTIMRPLDDLLTGEPDDVILAGESALDDARGFGGVGELASLRISLRSAPSVREKLSIMIRMLDVITTNGAQTEDDRPRNPTAQHYTFDPNRKRSQRVKDNEAAMALLARIEASGLTSADLTDEEKSILAKYSGTGGALVGADGKKGSAYEYYTPKPIAEGMWDLLEELGFYGGRVLDPCGGVGVFGATAPSSSVVDAVELNETSGKINGLVNGGPGYRATVAPFEKVAAATPDETYDAVVSNVPFGEVADRGGNQLLDKRYQKEPIQNYFILRSLEKLKPGGLAAFITPPRCVSGRDGAEVRLRVQASYMAEFLGAYRLPNKVFGTANADTMTDVIVFRKFARDVLEKIEELREQSPQTLVDANVQWPELTEGRYFLGEGKRFMLGEFVPKDPEKFRDVDRVVTNASVGEIGKMMRKFPGSRINWDLLGATETAPIIYREGDTLAQAGVTLQMKDGRWVPLDTGGQADVDQMLGKLANPYAGFESAVTFEQASDLMAALKQSDRLLDAPAWLSSTLKQLEKVPAGQRPIYWSAGVVGQSVAQVLRERLSEEQGVNYAQEYPALTDSMQRVAIVAKSASGMTGLIKEGFLTLGSHYSKKGGFSAVWRGDVKAEVDTVEVTSDGSFEGIRYRTKSVWVSMDDARRIYGESFDPMGSPDWCISGDGQRVTKAADYYVGNYADFLRRIDAEIASATDPALRDKLTRQKIDAGQHAGRLDVSQMQFNLFSPLVTEEEKAEFLRRFVHPAADVFYDEKTGKKYVDIDIKGSNLTERDKLIKRIGDYMQKGTVTLGGTKLATMSDADGLRELRKMINTANEQFNAWSRGNPVIMSRIEATANDPERLRFKPVDDEAAISIQGMRVPPRPHGYQASFVRQMARDFSGINGFGVGLGKTLTALCVAQYAQSIGAKKKTVFVVPNSVLSNWRKEAIRAYESMDDCLFVGLRVNKAGDGVVKSSEYDTDLTAIMENRHSKIFMTMEAFERLRMRDETISRYEAYLRQVDASFAESEDKKRDEQNKGKAKALVEILGGKNGAAPFIEDLGIDSLIIDEGHNLKNASTTVNFKSAKYLSLAPAAKRGIDAQAKAWFIRGRSPLGDGVLMLTATPITNSPLEIYSMLTLAVGHERVNSMCVGVQGADAFMDLVCSKVNEDDVTMDGVARTTDVFVGLKNVNVLRHALGGVATIKNAADVGGQIVVPERVDEQASIGLPDEVKKRLALYKSAFRYAIDEISEKVPNRGDPEAFDAVQQHFGEPLELIGHPFNLISKMTMLIADPELDRRGTFYTFPAGQATLAKKVAEAFNAKKFTEERGRLMPLTAPDAVVSTKTKKNEETGATSTSYKIAVRAMVEEGNSRFAIDTMDHATQQAFEAMAEKMGLDLDVTVPPKLAALLENAQKEQATPRGVNEDGKPSKIVKQIIFCDILPLHSKIKRLLSKRAGIPAAKIAIITGQVNNEPDEILDVQDGFNADGEANRFSIIIANEKAEVGINLQKGTQAIHHLTIGWTPDSLEQRNGRGVRQGNKTEKVTIYHYDAKGTFDTSKRTMVNKKADWIESVMSSSGANSVAVSGGLSREQQEALIDAVGDEEAVKNMEVRLADQEARARAQANRERQAINLDTVAKQKAFLDSNPDATRMVAERVAAYRAIRSKVIGLRDRINSPKATESAIAKNKAALAEAEARMAELSRDIEASADVGEQDGRYVGGKYEVEIRLLPLDQVINRFDQRAKRGETSDQFLIDALAGKGWSRAGIGLKLKEDGPIQQELRVEVDLAKAMLEGAIEAYEAQSREAGGLPANLARAMAEGAATMIDGVPLQKGDMIRVNDDVGVVTIENDGSANIYFMSTDGRTYSVPAGSYVKRGFTSAGTSEHLALVRYAAKLEDDLAAQGRAINAMSEMIPEVSGMRATAKLACYDPSKFTLPHPYYPFVIPEIDAKRSPVLEQIARQQAAVVKSVDWRGFVVEADLAVIPFNGALSDRSRTMRDALVAYAKANGVKLQVGRDLLKHEVLYLVEEAVGKEGFVAALTGDSADALRAAAKSAVLEALGGVLDYAVLDPIDNDLLPFEHRRALSTALAALARGAGPQDALVTAGKTEGQASSGNPNDIVGITGETKRWMGLIKQAASMAGQGRYKWDGKALCWNVYRSTWDHLVANNPVAANELRIVRGTRYSI